MTLAGDTIVHLELDADLVALLQAIAEKQGLLKEDVAAQAIELWVEQYRSHGPAFSRRPRPDTLH